MIIFYQEIEPFFEFEQITDLSFFHQAPDDWVVLITDIKGSTLAANQGRGKDVNMLGAAVITLISNFFQSLQIPFVFGGDGATLLMPKKNFEDLRKPLVGLMKLAHTKFGLELRVGAVGVDTLLTHGHPVLVAKYQTNPHAQFGQMLGSGLSQAEKWIKQEDSKSIRLSLNDESIQPDLSGLSCRLTPFYSKAGVIISLIVRPKNENDSTWIRGHFLQALKKILRNDFQSANPVRKESLNWKFIPATLGAEILFSPAGFLNILKVTARVILANTLLKLNISAGGFRPEKYKSEVPIQSDFKKFDDNLRMVMDCTLNQALEIENLLEHGQTEGHIFYGLHKTQMAEVTCITHTASQGQHIHFVDGEKCGYTMAALQIKKQMI